MCTSPHEMTSARLEQIIQNYKRSLADPDESPWHDHYQWRVDEFEKILKERAEDGTYDSAGRRPGDRNETQRTRF